MTERIAREHYKTHKEYKWAKKQASKQATYQSRKILVIMPTLVTAFMVWAFHSVTVGVISFIVVGIVTLENGTVSLCA